MVKLKFSILLLALMTMTNILASSGLTIEEINSGLFAPKGIRNIVSMLDGEHYTQLSDDNTQIVKYSYKTGKQVGVVFDVKTARECSLDHIDGYTFSPDEKRILIQTETTPIYRHSYTAVYYLFNVANNKLQKLTEGAIRIPTFSPDGNQLAFVRDNDIFLIKFLYGYAESRVTKDGELNKVINGAPDWVYEEEFAFNSALTFSPDSKMIAYIKWNESNVPTYTFPLYKGLAPALDEYADYPGTYSYKYPIAGQENSEVSVMTFDIFTKVTKRMDLDISSEDYIPRIKFTNDPDKLAVITLNRHQNRLDLYYANPKTGVCNLIHREENDRYLRDNILESIQFYDNNFTIISERNGWPHIYLYTLSGTLVKQVTDGEYEVKRLYGWDEEDDLFYYLSNEGSPLTTSVWKIDRRGNKTRLSDDTQGINSAGFSAKYNYFINSFQNVTTPNVYTIKDNRGKTLCTLKDNSEVLELAQAANLPQKEFFTFTTADGTTLNGWMMKPLDFDAGKKYPVLMYQYSGPGSQQVLDAWSVSWETYMTTLGYITVCVDGRGTGGRGEDFEKCTYMSIGVKEADDQVAAARYLGTLPYVDKGRIGIWGWSYGGYMTLMSMCQGAKVFKVGIAVAAPTDWRYYDSVYTERYMRTPQENDTGYDKSSVFSRIDKMHGKLLLVHGSADDNVHLRNMMEFSEALVQEGIDFDMMVYTNRNHGIAGGNTRNHLYNKLTNYIKANL